MRIRVAEPLVEEDAIAELSHRINSPLAAIRNSLYLIGCRCTDPEVHRYLQMADEEVGSIAEILQQARTRAACAAKALEPQARAASAGRRGVV